jgi:hypothetical protein
MRNSKRGVNQKANTAARARRIAELAETKSKKTERPIPSPADAPAPQSKQNPYTRLSKRLDSDNKTDADNPK